MWFDLKIKFDDKGACVAVKVRNNRNEFPNKTCRNYAKEEKMTKLT